MAPGNTSCQTSTLSRRSPQRWRTSLPRNTQKLPPECTTAIPHCPVHFCEYSAIQSLIWCPKQPEQSLMLLGEIHHDRVPLPPDTEHMNSYEIVEDPPRRGVLHRFAFLVGKRRVMRLQGCTNAILQRGIHQQTHGHDHEQRHDALALFQIQRGGEKLRVLQKSESAFRMH